MNDKTEKELIQEEIELERRRLKADWYAIAFMAVLAVGMITLYYQTKTEGAICRRDPFGYGISLLDKLGFEFGQESYYITREGIKPVAYVTTNIEPANLTKIEELLK